jgi:hypothetical protein
MVNSLGFADMDDVDALELVEQAFDIKIAATEAATLANVGDLYDLLLTKIPDDEANQKCASAMVFYRLRRALPAVYAIEKIGPSYDLLALNDISAKRLLRVLAKKSGLTLPYPSPGWVGWLAWCFAMVCFWPVALTAYVIFLVSLPKALIGWLAAAWACAFVVMIALAILDSGRLPSGCHSLGGLAKKTARLNFGKLRELGARQSDLDIWDALVATLSSFNDFPVEKIRRDTFFFRDAMKDHQKRAA